MDMSFLERSIDLHLAVYRCLGRLRGIERKTKEPSLLFGQLALTLHHEHAGFCR